MGYNDEDYLEWVKDGAEYLAKIETKQIIDDYILDIFRVKQPVLDDPRIVDSINKVNEKILELATVACQNVLLQNLQKIFIICKDNEISPESAIKISFTSFPIGLFGPAISEPQINHAMELCLSRIRQ